MRLFIVQTGSDYALLEWFGGHDPDKGDVLIGDFKHFGFRDFTYRNDEDRTSRFYIDDYGLSKSTAMEKLIEKCG